MFIYEMKNDYYTSLKAQDTVSDFIYQKACVIQGEDVFGAMMFIVMIIVTFIVIKMAMGLSND